MADASSPIGVFDSGVGGLTVLRALMDRLPLEGTMYLGDTARVPYGTKSAEVVTRYSLRIGRFLVDRGVKLLVVACNTASSVALEAMSRELPVPVLGVIEPGAFAAAQRTQSGRVAVIGTPGTIRSGAYQAALAKARPNVVVNAKACPLFVPLAEEGWTQGDVPALVAREYLSELREHAVDTLVLGCTHYPLLRNAIAEVMGPKATAEAVAKMLASSGLLAQPGGSPGRTYFVTDIPDRFLAVAPRFLGREVASAEQVDL
jgi:glutamate racemase